MFVDCAPSQHPLKHSPTSNSCTWPSGLLIEPTRLGKPSTGVAEQDGMHLTTEVPYMHATSKPQTRHTTQASCT